VTWRKRVGIGEERPRWARSGRSGRFGGTFEGGTGGGGGVRGGGVGSCGQTRKKLVKMNKIEIKKTAHGRTSNKGGGAEPSPFTSKGVEKSGEGLRPPRLRRIGLKQAGRG